MLVANPTDAGLHSAIGNCRDQAKRNGGMTSGEAGPFCATTLNAAVAAYRPDLRPVLDHWLNTCNPDDAPADVCRW
jgi:hypothetical protein